MVLLPGTNFGSGWRMAESRFVQEERGGDFILPKSVDVKQEEGESSQRALLTHFLPCVYSKWLNSGRKLVLNTQYRPRGPEHKGFPQTHSLTYGSPFLPQTKKEWSNSLSQLKINTKTTIMKNKINVGVCFVAFLCTKLLPFFLRLCLVKTVQSNNKIRDTSPTQNWN